MSHNDSDLTELREKYQDQDWFADVGLDEYSRCVVYVKYMNREVLSQPNCTEEGREVCFHFIASKTATKDQFIEKQGGVGLPVYKPIYNAEIDVSATIPDPVEEASQVTERKSLQYLQSSLDKLEKACGSYTLQDIFYEIHDGKNAVTNNAARYPEVKNKLEKLYREYGFDVIYEELDG
jgi:hypothetical protein